MRRAGAVAAEILRLAGEMVRPGITTDEIDEYVHQLHVERDAYPSPLNYNGFPKSVCTSANEVICHGIPDSPVLQDGDILNLDVTSYVDGVHGDTNATFFVGDVDPVSRQLVRVTEECMWHGIEAVRPGRPISDIGRAIEEHAKAHRYGVIRAFIGHGIGEQFHADIQVLHYYDSRASMIMRPGMTFTIEPMISLGTWQHRMWDDDWTAVTADGKRTAQFEHTILVTDDGVDVLTGGPGAARRRRPGIGDPAADRSPPSSWWSPRRAAETRREPEALPDVSLAALDGTGPALELASCDGPAVVNLWATWCAPCRRELPAFQEVSARRPDVRFVGVDIGEQADHARAFLDELGITFDQFADPTGELTDALGVAGLPITLVVDDAGMVATEHLGPMSADDLEDAIDAL